MSAKLRFCEFSRPDNVLPKESSSGYAQMLWRAFPRYLLIRKQLGLAKTDVGS